MKINEWQFTDASNGLIYPWYVKPFLDKLQLLDLSNASIFEYGLGHSTLWYGNKAKIIYGVDDNLAWFNYIYLSANINTNLHLTCYPQDGSIENGKKRYIDEIYASINKQSSYDIIVVDGLYRDECILNALHFLKIEGILIVDNWCQPSVWMPLPSTKNLLSKYHSKVYKQPDHPDWQTAIFSRTALNPLF